MEMSTVCFEDRALRKNAVPATRKQRRTTPVEYDYCRIVTELIMLLSGSRMGTDPDGRTSPNIVNDSTNG